MLMIPNFINEIIAAHIVQMWAWADCGFSDFMAKRCQPFPGNWTFCHLQSADDGLETGGIQSNFLLILGEASSRWRSIRCNNFINHTVSLQPCWCPGLMLDTMTNSGTDDLVFQQVLCLCQMLGVPPTPDQLSPSASPGGLSHFEWSCAIINSVLSCWTLLCYYRVAHLCVLIILILKWIHSPDNQSHTLRKTGRVLEKALLSTSESTPSSHSHIELLADRCSILRLFWVWHG